MSNSISRKWDLWMVAVLVCVAVVLGISQSEDYEMEESLNNAQIDGRGLCG